MTIAYTIITAVSVLLWLPIACRFYRSWLHRRNPVSLAICAAILLIMWTAAAGLWIVTDNVNHATAVLVTTGMSVAAALYAHAAFCWSKRRFPSTRRKT